MALSLILAMTASDSPSVRPRRYFAIHFLIFRFLGLGWWHHPDQQDTTNFPGFYIYYAIVTEIVWVGLFVGLETIDPFVGEKDMDRFMFSLAFVITHDLTIIKLYIFFFRNKEIQEIVRTLEIGMYEFYQNDVTIKKTIRITRIFTGMFLIFGWITIANSNVYGIIQDIRWKAEASHINNTSLLPLRTLPQPIYIPWNYQSDKSFILTFAVETVGLLWTGHIVMTVDTFIGSIIFHMSKQFVMLQEAFETAYDRTITQLLVNIIQEQNLELRVSSNNTSQVDEYYNRNENNVMNFYTEEQIEKALEKTLKDCIRQHEVLIGCVRKFALTYSYGFMTQLLSSVAAICAVMMQVSQDASSFKSIRLVTSVAFFTAMIIQLAIQCFTGNELTLQAGKVSEAAMRCRWERLSPRLRRMLVLVMVRAQKPLHLSAAGFTNINNDCFLAIMKAAYSYYAVLSQKQVVSN